MDDCLFREGYEVIHPAMDGEETDAREYHRDNLLTCDAALIYYGATSESWLRTKLRDLDKAFGYGRQNNWRARAVYVGPQETTQKDRFRTHEAVVIRNYDQFKAELLEPFVAQLRMTP